MTGDLEKAKKLTNFGRKRIRGILYLSATLAYIYSPLGRHDNAIEETLQDLRLAPDNSIAYFVGPI